jgi:carbonic anhydrase/acetyltransferase-like protein (isoleucine patch superfamily)
MIRKYNNKVPKLGKNVYVDEAAIVIGDVEIGDDASIWPTTVLRGDMHFIRIGQRTSIQDGSICHITHDGQFAPGGFPLIVGDDVTIGHQAVLHGCTIHDKCLIGMQSLILDGAVIESNVVLGAGSLVSPGKVLESGYLYVGRPAVQKRKLTTSEIEFMLYSAQNYVDLKNTYLTS